MVSFLVEPLQSSSLPEAPEYLAGLTPPQSCIPDTLPRTRRAHQGTPELHAGTNSVEAPLVTKSRTNALGFLFGGKRSHHLERAAVVGFSFEFEGAVGNGALLRLNYQLPRCESTRWLILDGELSLGE